MTIAALKAPELAQMNSVAISKYIDKMEEEYYDKKTTAMYYYNLAKQEEECDESTEA